MDTLKQNMTEEALMMEMKNRILHLEFDYSKTENLSNFSFNLKGGGVTMASLESKLGNIFFRESK